jgi:hypothetical protein
MRSCSRSAAGVCATVRAGLAGVLAVGGAVVKRSTPPQPESARTAHSSEPAAQNRWPAPLSRRPAHPVTSATHIWPGGLIPTKHFNLSHPEHLDSRAAPRLDPAADTNPSILQGLKADSGRLMRRRHPP